MFTIPHGRLAFFDPNNEEHVKIAKEIHEQIDRGEYVYKPISDEEIDNMVIHLDGVMLDSGRPPTEEEYQEIIQGIKDRLKQVEVQEVLLKKTS